MLYSDYTLTSKGEEMLRVRNFRALKHGIESYNTLRDVADGYSSEVVDMLDIIILRDLESSGFLKKESS